MNNNELKNFFTNKDFTVENFINSYLKYDKQIDDIEILNFKANTINKDLQSEIALNNAKLIKAFPSLEVDLNNYSSHIDLMNKKYSALKSNQNIKNNSLSDLTKAILALKFINNLKKVIERN